MLIEFRVRNFRSIGDEQVLSLVPAPKQKEYSQNIIEEKGYQALNTVAIYGANGSGKSNLIFGMSTFLYLVSASGRFSSNTALPWDPFMLRAGYIDQPTGFEVVFILDGVRYRYGFDFNSGSVLKEWLYRKGAGREVTVFLRDREIIDPSSAFKANAKLLDAAIEATKPNGLFLSSCDVFNITEAVSILKFFKYFTAVDGNQAKVYESSVIGLWIDQEFREAVVAYMERMGTGVAGIELKGEKKDDHFYFLAEKMMNSSNSSLDEDSQGMYSRHFIYDRQGKKTKETISWRFEDRESSGTNKALHLTGPILFALKYGGVLFIDEIEANMHPIMTLDTINMFLDPLLNKKNAQLILTTHDTNLLTYAKLRRDQIYFVEKNSWESSELYSLSDFSYPSDFPGPVKERPDTDKEKRYLEGRYGGVPTLGKLVHLLGGRTDG